MAVKGANTFMAIIIYLRLENAEILLTAKKAMAGCSDGSSRYHCLHGNLKLQNPFRVLTATKAMEVCRDGSQRRQRFHGNFQKYII